MENRSLSQIPKILLLDSTGNPIDWVGFEEFATLKAKDKIIWTTGTYACTIRGGTNAATGKRTELVMDTIAAVKHDTSKKSKHRNDPSFNPTLTNKMLFERDRYLCAYCGQVYARSKLTRDHIMPVSRGGKDVWTNVVTSCSACNLWKDDRTPEEAEMELLYVPYRPTFHEHLILKNRNCLADQMDFLIKGVSPNSPLYKDYLESKEKAA